jgi:hypothetical protein
VCVVRETLPVVVFGLEHVCRDYHVDEYVEDVASGDFVSSKGREDNPLAKKTCRKLQIPLGDSTLASYRPEFFKLRLVPDTIFSVKKSRNITTYYIIVLSERIVVEITVLLG